MPRPARVPIHGADAGRACAFGATAGHPYYVATQYHPEFKTRPLSPSPVFVGLILAASGQLTGHLAGTVAVGFDH